MWMDGRTRWILYGCHQSFRRWNRDAIRRSGIKFAWPKKASGHFRDLSHLASSWLRRYFFTKYIYPRFSNTHLQLSSIMLTRPTALGSVFKSLSLRALHTTRPALFLPTSELPPNPTSAEALGFAPQGDRKRLLPQNLKVDVPASANSNVSALKDARKVSALSPSTPEKPPTDTVLMKSAWQGKAPASLPQPQYRCRLLFRRQLRLPCTFSTTQSSCTSYEKCLPRSHWGCRVCTSS